MFKIDNDTLTMTVIRKDTALFTLTLDNYTLNSGDKVKFAVSATYDSQEPLIYKEVSEFEEGKATFNLGSSDTDIEPGTYFYDIQVDTIDGRVDTVMGPAKFKVLGGVVY